MGKGSQAKYLEERDGISHISTGAIFREKIRQGTPVGKLVEEYVHDGKLVPDDIVRVVAEEAVAEHGYDRFVLDGYPRTTQQAVWLDEFLTEHDCHLEVVVSLVAPDEVVIDRLSKRRVDKETGRNYHLEFKPPPPDIPAERIIQRRDDQPEIILQRLEHYREMTEPVEDFYRGHGVLVEVDAVGTFDEVHDRIIDVLKERTATVV